MQSRGQKYAVWIVSSIVVVAVGAMYLPSRVNTTQGRNILTADEIVLTSPDGNRVLRITCQNNGAGLFIRSGDGKQMVHLFSGDLGDQLTLGGRSESSSMIRMTTMDDTAYGAIPQPSIKVYDHEGHTHRLAADY